LPGSRSLTLSHCSSEISCRRIASLFHEPSRRPIRGSSYAENIDASNEIRSMNVNTT
jgi:hypothetical protein